MGQSLKCLQAVQKAGTGLFLFTSYTTLSSYAKYITLNIPSHLQLLYRTNAKGLIFQLFLY